MVSAAVRLPGFAPPFSYNPSISPGFGGSGGRTLLPLTLLFSQNSGADLGSAPPATLYAPGIISVDVKTTAGFDPDWLVEYSWGEPGVQLVNDPDGLSRSPGVRVALRGAQRDLSEDQIGPQAVYVYESAGSYTLRVWARDHTVTNGWTHYSEQEIVITTPTWSFDETIGADGDHVDLATALSTRTGDNLRFRFLRDETHAVDGDSITNRDNILLEADSAGTALPILVSAGGPLDGDGGIAMTSTSGNWSAQIRVRNLIIRPTTTGTVQVYNPTGPTSNQFSDGCAIGFVSNSGIWDCEFRGEALGTGFVEGASSGYAFGQGVHMIGITTRSGTGGANEGPTGTLALRITRDTSVGFNCNEQVYFATGCVNGFFIGCEADTSNQEDICRFLRDGANQRSATGCNGLTVAWCDFSRDGIAGQNATNQTGKGVLRSNGPNWTYLYNNSFIGRTDLTAADGGEPGVSPSYVQSNNRCVASYSQSSSLLTSGGVFDTGGQDDAPAYVSCIGYTNLFGTSVGCIKASNDPSFALINNDGTAFRHLTVAAALSGGSGAQFMDHDYANFNHTRSNWRMRGCLFVAPDSGATNPDASDSNAQVININSETVENTFVESRENCWPDNSVMPSGNFFDDSGSPRTFTQWSALGFVDGDIQEQHSVTNLLANGWVPNDSNTSWETLVTPNPLEKVDYRGVHRNQLASSWRAGAIGAE